MKAGRQAKIIELIRNHDIRTQEDLILRLHEEGFDVTQATVSRDIRELGLIKLVGGDGDTFYKLPGESAGFSATYLQILRNGYVSMDTAGNILVIKTVPGMAMGVAFAVDALKLPEVVGCIAGDDTIMVVIKTPEACEAVNQKLSKLIMGG